MSTNRQDILKPEFKSLLNQATEELSLKMAAHEAAFGISKAKWDVDQDTGTLTLTGRNGMTAVCPVQIIGTYNKQDATWLWAWDNASIEIPLQEHARQLQRLGTERHWTELTGRKLKCTKEDALGFAALACKVSDSQGAYAGNVGDTIIYMTFGTITLHRQA